MVPDVKSSRIANSIGTRAEMTVGNNNGRRVDDLQRCVPVNGDYQGVNSVSKSGHYLDISRQEPEILLLEQSKIIPFDRKILHELLETSSEFESSSCLL